MTFYSLDYVFAVVERGFDFDLGYLETKGGKSTSVSEKEKKIGIIDGNTSCILQSELRKQSLYLKFDPLVAGEHPQQSRSLIGRKSDIIDLQGHINLTHFNEDPAKKTEKPASIPDLLCDSPSKYAKSKCSSFSSHRKQLLFTTTSGLPALLVQDFHVALVQWLERPLCGSIVESYPKTSVMAFPAPLLDSQIPCLTFSMNGKLGRYNGHVCKVYFWVRPLRDSFIFMWQTGGRAAQLTTRHGGPINSKLCKQSKGSWMNEWIALLQQAV